MWGFSTVLSRTLCFVQMTIIAAQVYETGDNSTVRGCSSHCKLEDADLSCWTETLSFYERVLLGHMRHYVAVQVDVDQWRRRKHQKTDFESVRNASVLAMSKHLRSGSDKELLNVETIVRVVDALIDRVEASSKQKISYMKGFRCPIPCEYRYDTWRYLFLASTALNVALALAVIPFIISVVRRDSNVYGTVR